MCIATFFPLKNSLVTTHNRDENINRKFSNSPSCTVVNYEKFVYYRDLLSSGTWMISSENTTACILNGANLFHKKENHHTQSRGNLLFEIVKHPTASVLSREIKTEGIQPFTAFLVQHNLQKFYQIQWNDIKLVVEEKEYSNPYIWLSSTLYNPKKKQLIAESFYQQNFKNAKEIQNWHIQHKMNLNDVNPKIKTVCLTQNQNKPSENRLFFTTKL